MKYINKKTTKEVSVNSEIIKVEYPLSSNEKQTAISVALEASKTLLDPNSNTATGKTVYSKLMFETVLYGVLASFYAPNLADLVEHEEEVSILELYDFLENEGVIAAILDCVPNKELKELERYADDAFERAVSTTTSGAVVLENFLTEIVKVLLAFGATQEGASE